MPESPARLVAEFHEWGYNEPFGTGVQNSPELRVKLHDEENAELIDALCGLRSVGTLDAFAAVAKELADVVYVAYGTAHSLGIPLDAVIAAVHASNMTKSDADGTPFKRADGKMLKGANYIPPEEAVRTIVRSAKNGVML